MGASGEGGWLTGARTVAVSAVITGALIATMAVARIDISAARDFRHDPVVRDAFPRSALPAVRYLDPAPFGIWISIDWLVWDSLRSGQLPLWDRMQGGGYSPLVALRGVLHPVRWTTALVPRESAPSALIVLALYLAALGAYLCARELDFERGPAAVAALLFALSPPVISLAQSSGAILPLAHFPWLILFYRRALGRRGFGSLSVLAVVVASLFVSGDPFMGVAILIAAAVFAFVDGIASGRIRPLIVIAFATLLGILLASIVFLPPLLAASDSVSGGVSTAMAGGVRYTPYALPYWWSTLRSILFDTPAQTCCVDSPSQIAYVGVFVLLLLIAALAAWRRDRSVRSFVFLTLAWLFLAIPGPWLLPLRFIRPFSWIPVSYYAGPLVLAVSLTAAAGFAFLLRRRGIVRATGGVLCVLAVGLYAWRAYGVLQPRRWQPIVAGSVVDVLRSQSQPSRVAGSTWAIHLPNSSRITDVEDLRITAPLVAARYVLWRDLASRQVAHRKAAPRHSHPIDSMLAADFNVSHVVQRRGEASPLHSKVVLETPSVTVRTSASPAHPRAHFAEQVVSVVDLDEAVRLLADERFAASDAVVVERDLQRDEFPPFARGRVDLNYPDDRHVVLETESDSGGLVVLHDTYDRGWRATIDGRELTIYAVNVLSRGVFVPKGRHRIEMTYVPPGLAEGAAMSTVAFVGLVALFLVRRHRHVLESGQLGAGLEALVDRMLAAGRRVSVARGGWAIVVVLAAALIVTSAARIDISAARGFLGDVLVRDYAAHPPPDKYHDLSPLYIWLPSDWFIWDSIRSGQLPLWDRLQGGGYSPVITIQNGVLHPFRWLIALFPRDAAPSVLIVLSLFAAFLGTYLLAAVEIRLSVPAALMAGLVYVFGGPFISMAHFSGGLVPLAHLPWLVLLLRRTLRMKDRLSFALLSIGFASLAASGHPLIIFTVVFGVVVFALAETLFVRSTRPLVITFAAGAVALLLGAFVLVPPYISLDDVWTYKSVTPDGINYMPSNLRGWTFSVWRSLFDLCKAGRCWPDDSSFYSYVGLAAAVLAALGFYVAISKRRHLGFAGAAVVFFLIGVPGPWMWLIADIPPFNFCKAWYLLGPFGLFFGIVCAIGYDVLIQSKRRDAHAAVFVFAALVLASYGPRTWNTYQPQRWQPIVFGEALEHVRSQSRHARITGLWGLVHQANSSRITGIEDLRLSGPIIPHRYHEWWRIIDPKVLLRSFPTTRMTDQLWSPLIGDFNTNTVIESRFPPFGSFKTIFWLAKRDKKRSPHMRPPVFPLTMETHSLRVYRNGLPVRPRAHFAEKVILVPDLDGAKRVLSVDRGAVAAVAAVVESAAPLEHLPARASGTVRLWYPSERRVVMETNSTTGGVVVLHDSHARGWTATVDRRAAEILPVNILSRGVVVPPGRHRVEMSFMPPGLIRGGVISLSALLALSVWCLFGVRRTSAAGCATRSEE